MNLLQVYKSEIGEASNVDHIRAIAQCIRHDEREGRLKIYESLQLLVLIEKEKRVTVTKPNITTEV